MCIVWSRDFSLIFPQRVFCSFCVCSLFPIPSHSVCIVVPLASLREWVCVYWWHKLFKSTDNKCPEKIAWHAKCIFSIFRSNVIVKTKQNWSVIDVAWTELNKVEIFIRHDLFGYDGRHVLHYVNAMINLLQIFLLKSNTSDLHRAPYAHWWAWMSARTHTLPIERFYALDGELMRLALSKIIFFDIRIFQANIILSIELPKL